MNKHLQHDGNEEQLLISAANIDTPWHVVQKHPRLVSEWESNVVCVNVAHSLVELPDIRTYNLGEKTISRMGHVSANGSKHYQLSDFPDFLISLKAAINSILFTRTELLGDIITNLINYALRLFIWMIKNNIFKLSQLTKEDAVRLSKDWVQGGWWHALDYERSLNKLMKLAKTDPDVSSQLRGRNNSKWFTVDTDAMQRMTGLPLSQQYMPAKYAAEIAQIVGASNLNPARASRDSKMTAVIYRRLMFLLNHFSTFPATLGGLDYVPFIKPGKIAENAFPDEGGRTKNISIDNLLKITSESLRWMTEYVETILYTAEAARTALENHENLGAVSERNIQSAVRDAYTRQIEAGGRGIPGITRMTRSDLSKCIDALQVACFCIIAINHGRRRNELIGKNLPYGLHFGCLSEISSLYDDWRIDIYVEKSCRAYVSFWCNDLVRQAVNVLERVSQVFRPLNQPMKQYSVNRADGRLDKLFCSRAFTKIGFDSSPEGFDFSSRASWFFELAQVDPDYFREKTQPFRRVYACLYMYRYDMPKAAALQFALRQDCATVTEVYYTDAPGTSPSDGVKAVYAGGYDRELVALEKVTEEVRSEYFGEIIFRMLNGEQIGGNFAKMTLKLMKRMSGSVKFRELELTSKAEIVSESLKRRGYSISPKEHGACSATDLSRTRGRSNCAVDGQIQPQNASPKMCGNCLHLTTTERYREGLSNALAELQMQSVDFKLPPAVRFKIKQDTADLDAYIKADQNVAAENQRLFSILSEKWSVGVIGTGN